MVDFFDAVEAAREEYEAEYKPELERVLEKRRAEAQEHKEQQLERLVKDMRLGGRTEVPVGPRRTPAKAQEEQGGEDLAEEDEEDEEEGELIDRELNSSISCFAFLTAPPLFFF
jgi:hypothetical protein